MWESSVLGLSFVSFSKGRFFRLQLILCLVRFSLYSLLRPTLIVLFKHLHITSPPLCLVCWMPFLICCPCIALMLALDYLTMILEQLTWKRFQEMISWQNELVTTEYDKPAWVKMWKGNDPASTNIWFQEEIRASELLNACTEQTVSRKQNGILILSVRPAADVTNR